MNHVLNDPRVGVRLPLKSSCFDCTAKLRCLPGTDEALSSRRIERMVVRRCQLDSGEHVYYKNQPVGGKLYAIRHGQFKLYQLHPQGVQQIVGFAGPGDVLGVEAVGLPRYRCSAIALCDSTLCEFSLARLTANPALSILPVELTRILSRVLGQEEWLTVQLGHSRARQKLIAFLLALASQVPVGAPLHLPLHMARRDIGSFLRLTPTTVSRLLRQLERDGLLRIELRGVLLLDPLGLQRLAGQ